MLSGENFRCIESTENTQVSSSLGAGSSGSPNKQELFCRVIEEDSPRPFRLHKLSSYHTQAFQKYPGHYIIFP